MRGHRPLELVLVALLGGCYLGGAQPFSPSSFGREPGWRSIDAVPVIHQTGELDCGAAATAMMLAYWGQPTDQAEVRAASHVPSELGLRADFLRSFLRTKGLGVALFEGTLRDLEHELEAQRPILVGVRKPYSDRLAVTHYLLVVGYNRSQKRLVVIDPADGWRVYSFVAFLREWEPTHRLTLVTFPI